MSDIITMAHDKDHPFSMISNSLIRNSNISRDARMILILCLSYKSLKNWSISVPYLRRQEGISKTKMYKIIDELLQLGFMKRSSFLEKGMKRFRYQVSEEPIFKKSLPCPKNQYPEKQDRKKEQALRKPFIPLKGTISCDRDYNLKILESLGKWLERYYSHKEQCLSSSQGNTRYTLMSPTKKWKLYPRSDSIDELLHKINQWNTQIESIYLEVNKKPISNFKAEIEPYLKKSTQPTG